MTLLLPIFDTHCLGGVTERTNATLVELEEQGSVLVQMRREMGTTREYLTRMNRNTSSVDHIASSPFLPPLNEDDLGASAQTQNESETRGLLGRNSMRRSVGELITFGSMRSVRGPCSLPIDNTFTTSM